MMDKTLTVSISATQGIRVAFRLLWDSVVALIHRDTVTFEVGEE